LRFIDELRSCPETVRRADNLEAFFSFCDEQFYQTFGGAGAFAIEQGDQMRCIIQQKRSLIDRLNELDRLLIKIAAVADARAEHARKRAVVIGCLS
jgi:hypothetical protein